MMSFLDCFNYIRKRFFDKNNIIFIIIFTLLMLIIYGCVTVMYFSYDVKNEMLNEYINMRKIITNATEKDLDGIEHIEYIVGERFDHTLNKKVPEFSTENEDGEIVLKAKLDIDKIQIKNGRDIQNKGEAICPEKFYPHSYDKEIYNSLYLKGDDIIGKTFIVKSKNEDNLGKETEFKIVGSYKNKTFVEANTCYIGIEDFINNQSHYSHTTTSTDIYGNTTVKNYGYAGNLVFADKYENLDYVVKALENKGFIADKEVTVDEQTLQYLFYIPLFVSIIVIIVCINIMYSFVVKKFKYKSYEIGILKTIGYQNKEIEKLEIFENIFVVIISFILALLFLIIGYKIVVQNYMADFTYANYVLPIPIVWLILISLIIILIISLMTNLRFIKISKNSVNDLFRYGVK